MNKPVLYVEDEEDDAMIMQVAWERAGMDCPLVVLPDGQQALDYLNGENLYSDRQRFPLPGLVLLDLNLPRKSGLEVLKTLREHFDKSQLPVVVFSSSDSPKDKCETAEAGANEYIVKPIGLQRLLDVLGSISALVKAEASHKN